MLKAPFPLPPARALPPRDSVRPHPLKVFLGQKMEAPPKPEIPIITQLATLEEADGLLFGMPARFGALRFPSAD